VAVSVLIPVEVFAVEDGGDEVRVPRDDSGRSAPQEGVEESAHSTRHRNVVLRPFAVSAGGRREKRSGFRCQTRRGCHASSGGGCTRGRRHCAR
jgi:hypothetical protein